MKTVIVRALADDCVARPIWMGENILLRAEVTEKTAERVKNVIEGYWTSISQPFELSVVVHNSHGHVMERGEMTMR